MPYNVRYLPGGHPAGEFDTLEQAMAHTGHTDLDDWCLSREGAGQIRTDWTLRYDPATDGGGPPLDYGDRDRDHPYLNRVWAIEAPGVAHELIALLAAGDLTRRHWGTEDGVIKAATRDRLPDADTTASIVAAQLAAHYAAAGELTPGLIEAVIAGTYSASDVVLDQAAIADISRRVADALRNAGIAVAPRPAVIRGGQDLELQAWPHAAWFGSPRAVAVAQRIVDALGAVTVATEICALGILGAISAFGSAMLRRLDRLGRTIHVVTIPAGPLPRWLCAFLSYMISHVLIPFGLPFLGVWLTCWPDSWHALAARWVPVAGWVAAGFAAEKLVGFRLRPAGVQPGDTQDGERKVAVVVSFVLAAAAAAWPWPGWWAAHLHLRVVLAVLYAAMAVFTSAVMISHARQRSRPGNARPRPGRR